ncbi:MAG: hypothetical protein ACK449_07235 [Planctomycetota bacterium]|jgi:hypothetical protein
MSVVQGDQKQTLRPAIDKRRLAMSGMQDDKKLPDDLGTAQEVILVQSKTLKKQKVKNDELNKSLQEALAEIRFLRSGKKRESTFPKNSKNESNPAKRSLFANRSSSRSSSFPRS